MRDRAARYYLRPPVPVRRLLCRHKCRRCCLPSAPSDAACCCLPTSQPARLPARQPASSLPASHPPGRPPGRQVACRANAPHSSAAFFRLCSNRIGSNGYSSQPLCWRGAPAAAVATAAYSLASQANRRIAREYVPHGRPRCRCRWRSTAQRSKVGSIFIDANTIEPNVLQTRAPLPPPPSAAPFLPPAPAPEPDCLATIGAVTAKAMAMAMAIPAKTQTPQLHS